VYSVLLGKLEVRDRSEDQGLDGRMGSEWILGRYFCGRGVDSTGLGYGLVAGSCESYLVASGCGAVGLVALLGGLFMGGLRRRYPYVCMETQ
jgi:hypothetical protein